MKAAYVPGREGAPVIQSLLTVAPEIVACVGEGRAPTVQELARLADRVRREIWGPRSAFAWGQDARDAAIRIASLRVAHVALMGRPPDDAAAADQAMVQRPALT